MKTKLFSFFLALVASVGITSAEIIDHVKIGDLYYNLYTEDQTAEITYQYSIDWDNYNGLTSVSIPSSVSYSGATYSVIRIGYDAFCYASLTSVTIPNSVKYISTDAFRGCSGLTSIKIPNSVTYIGDAFSGCSSLPIENHIRYADTYLIETVDKSLSSYNIKDGTRFIGANAFSGCANLTSVTIPESVILIGEDAFNGCTSLTSITIPDSVTIIGWGAFVGCSSLRSIYIESPNPAGFSGSADRVPWQDIFPSYENIIFYVPCGSVETYENTWGTGYHGYKYCYSLEIPCDRFREPELPYELTCYVSEEEMGSVSYPKSICEEMIVSATPYDGYYFVKWTDGNTDNPRAIELTQDTSFTAIFAPNPQVTYVYDESKGWIEGPNNATLNSSITITAEPYYGYYFVHWADGNTDNPRTIELTQDTIMEAVFAYVTYVYDGSMGWVGGSAGSNNSITITAEPSRGCYFVKWADGKTDNPRIIEMTQDTTMEVIFGYLPTGKCGKNEALTWTFDAKTKALEITGKGELTDNFTYTYNLESVTIGNEISIIGEYAFADCYKLKNIIIGSSVKVIESHAFEIAYECTYDEYGNEDCHVMSQTITCYSQRPPTVKENAFGYDDLPYSTIIYVPADYLATYKSHDFWGMFDVRPLGAATVETSDVKVTPSETTANVVWPAVDNAATYELVIKDKSGVVICTLIFNANGQLTQIAFNGPARDNAAQASGFSFTVTGLEGGTSYDLTITSKDDQGKVLQTQTQSFTTAGAASGIHQTNATAAPQKVLRDGKVLILRDGKTYTIQGQEVR